VPTPDVDRATVLKFDDEVIRLDGKVAIATVDGATSFS